MDDSSFQEPVKKFILHSLFAVFQVKMTKCIVIFALLSFIASINCQKQFGLTEWNTFKIKHGKVYNSSSEDFQRLLIWINSKKEVEKHNKLFGLGKISYRKAVNKFSDMTSTELKRFYTGLKIEKPTGVYEKRVVIKPKKPIGDEMDWRDEGAVTPVKNQGKCGSCYAFSVTGALEGQHSIKSGRLMSLSEQQIIDCSGQKGCQSGWMGPVYNYIAQNGGIESEDSYPYWANDNGECQFNYKFAVTTDTGYQQLLACEINLKNAVATIGPLSAAIFMADSFYHYSGGIYNEPYCIGDFDHAVLVVGFGSDKGNDYWLVKNSWGTDWGENGYIKMSRNKNNQCGIASYVTFPSGVAVKKQV